MIICVNEQFDETHLHTRKFRANANEYKAFIICRKFNDDDGHPTALGDGNSQANLWKSNAFSQPLERLQVNDS